MDALTKNKLEAMVVSMRKSGLAHNSISSYCRVLRTFLGWCQREGMSVPPMPQIKDKETVKESYTDEELAKLSVARRYQLAQQCLYISDARPDEARALAKRLGSEYLAWYEYMLRRKAGIRKGN